MNFDEWWNEGYDDKDNPFAKDSFGYWAFAGWYAQQQQETQEPMREWVGLTADEVLSFVSYTPHTLTNKTSIVYAVEAKLKEKNT